MSKTITIQLVNSSPKTGPFTISDEYGNIISSDVAKSSLILGISYIVDDNVTMITLTSTGKCKLTKTFSIGTINTIQLANNIFTETKTGCLWRHLTPITIYNNYYGDICPYIIEYPFSTLPSTEILQSVKDYSKVSEYIPDTTGVFSYTDKINVDDKYFNKLVIYNDQQSSGILELVAKPKNNLHEYLKYPIYKTDSKAIIYTKSDNSYQINGFYDIVNDKTKQLFITSCESLSIDRIVNQDNMIYTQRSFNKSPMRAKDVKCRFILDNNSSVNIVSQLLLTLDQISYK